MLSASLQTQPTDDPFHDLWQSYWRYYEFSKQHPEYFALIFLERTLPTVRDTTRFMFLKDLKEQNDRALERCVEEGVFPSSTDVERAGRVLWASIHGPSVIGLTWRLVSATPGGFAGDRHTRDRPGRIASRCEAVRPGGSAIRGRWVALRSQRA